MEDEQGLWGMVIEGEGIEKKFVELLVEYLLGSSVGWSREGRGIWGADGVICLASIYWSLTMCRAGTGTGLAGEVAQDAV